MASGQGPGPPRQDCEGPAPASTSEEQVARDTEEVFRSYVFYRHQQEQEAEAAVPPDPEMVTLSPEPASTLGQVGRQLAIIGDDINQRFDLEFHTMLQHLQPTPENAYQYFTKIASRPAAMPTGNLPAASVHCSALCPLRPQHRAPGGGGGGGSPILCPLSFLLSQSCRLSPNSSQAGTSATGHPPSISWQVAALDLGNGPIRNVLIVLAVVLLGQFVVRRFFQS
ncbi:PREDICTED: bcl-2 homologous antagonist/killer [Myotis davidii]|uniref:bcl-2 homologous antagonist/killer n=1 Tax=Myotis davidii TaxID=225400 RepID=UPI000767978D|nr:PREDICTED: bcl-2 homologous antagonist/killer [Myotis davidii]